MNSLLSKTKQLGGVARYAAVATILTLGAAAGPAAACTCREGDDSAQKSLANRSAVFAGFVELVAPGVFLEPAGRPELTVAPSAAWDVIKVRALRGWKGIREEEVLVLTENAGCGVRFEVGKVYLFWGDSLIRDKEGAGGGRQAYVTSVCHGTVEIARAFNDLRDLGKPQVSFGVAGLGAR